MIIWFIGYTTTIILVLLFFVGNTIMTVEALAWRTAFTVRGYTLTVTLLTVGFLAAATFCVLLYWRQAKALFYTHLKLWLGTARLWIAGVVAATDAYTMWSALIALSKTLAIHFEAHRFLAVASLFFAFFIHLFSRSYLNFFQLTRILLFGRIREIVNVRMWEML